MEIEWEMSGEHYIKNEETKETKEREKVYSFKQVKRTGSGECTVSKTGGRL